MNEGDWTAPLLTITSIFVTSVTAVITHIYRRLSAETRVLHERINRLEQLREADRAEVRGNLDSRYRELLEELRTLRQTITDKMATTDDLTKLDNAMRDLRAQVMLRHMGSSSRTRVEG